MKYDILQIGSFPSLMQQEICDRFNCWQREDLTRIPLLKEQILGIITRSNCDVSEKFVTGLPRLKVIATCGVGYDLIPLESARKAEVIVTNTPNVLNAAVVELGFGLIFSLLRQIPMADRYIRSGQWLSAPYPLTNNLAGKRVGIAGMGSIGQDLARCLSPFGVSISYYCRHILQLPYHYETSLLALARASDILVLTVPGGASTHHMVNRDILSALGPDGYLINIARGSVVDEAALIEALQSGRIAGAALDVFAQEPDINPQLLKLKNLVLSPHAGSATVETRLAMVRLALDNLDSVLKCGAPLTPVPWS